MNVLLSFVEVIPYLYYYENKILVSYLSMELRNFHLHAKLKGSVTALIAVCGDYRFTQKTLSLFSFRLVKYHLKTEMLNVNIERSL